MTWLILALLTPAFAGSCPTGAVSASALDVHIDEAMLSFASLDEVGFIDFAGRADATLPCVTEPLRPGLIGSYYRLVGVRAFLDGDTALATTAFTMAQRVEPDEILSRRIAPEGGKLAKLFEQSRPAEGGGRVSLHAPKGFTIYVDGKQTAMKFHDASVIVQLVDVGGRAVWTGVLQPREDIPADWKSTPGLPLYVATGAVADATPKPTPQPEPEPVVDVTPEPEPEPELDPIVDLDEPDPVRHTPPLPEPEPEPEPIPVVPTVIPKPTPDPVIPMDLDPRVGGSKGSKKPFVVGAVASGIAAGALFGVSALSRSSFDRSPTQGGYHLTNGTYYAAIGTGAVGVVFLSTALAVKGGGK